MLPIRSKRVIMPITSMAVDDLASLDAASVDDACEVSHLDDNMALMMTVVMVFKKHRKNCECCPVSQLLVR